MPKGGWQEFNSPGKPPSQARATERSIQVSQLPRAEKTVRVQRTRGGKKGKTVTEITGLELSDLDARSLLKKLKARAGTGGTIKETHLELQGDQVAVVLALLETEGFRPKQAGG